MTLMIYKPEGALLAAKWLLRKNITCIQYRDLMISIMMKFEGKINIKILNKAPKLGGSLEIEMYLHY